MKRFLILTFFSASLLITKNAQAAIAFVQSKSNDAGTVISEAMAFTPNNTAGNDDVRVCTIARFRRPRCRDYTSAG